MKEAPHKDGAGKVLVLIQRERSVRRPTFGASPTATIYGRYRTIR